MKKFILAAFSLLLTFSPTTASAQKFEIPVIVSQEGDFLGFVVSNPFDSKSICNPYGNYGNPYGETIFNRYGRHGGEYSNFGAYNPLATKPPVVIVNGKIVGFVTKNRNFGQARIDPDMLLVEVCGR